jgi:hypothetical protein
VTNGIDTGSLSHVSSNEEMPPELKKRVHSSIQALHRSKSRTSCSFLNKETIESLETKSGSYKEISDQVLKEVKKTKDGKEKGKVRVRVRVRVTLFLWVTITMWA